MPDRQAHLAQATHNDEFAKSLVDNSDGPHDWAVTVIFYAALHYFEYWLLGNGIDVLGEARRKKRSPHTIRREKARDHLPDEMAGIYRMLRQQSELARYLTTRDGRRELSLPSLPSEYFSQNSAGRYYEDLERLKTYFSA